MAQLAAAKQTTDQCAGGLGQRMVEEYGRAGGFERRLPAAREFYVRRAYRILPADFDSTVSQGSPGTNFGTDASLNVESEPGGGTAVSARVPLVGDEH